MHRLELTPELIAWSTQVIPQSHYIKLHHILWPRALFTAIRRSVSVFYGLQKLQFKTFLNLPLSDYDLLLQAALKGEDQRRKLKEALEQASTGASTGIKDPQQFSTPHRTSIHPPELTPPKPSKIPPGTADSSLNPPGQYNLYILRVPPSNNFTLTARTFFGTLLGIWQQTAMDPHPQGCFFVFGQIEIAGDKGRCKLQVDAAYDPKARRYSYVVVKLKHLWDFTQVAKGGP